MGETKMSRHAVRKTQYTVMQGYFKQSDASTDDSTFDYTREHLGLIPRVYDNDNGVYDQKVQEPSWKAFTAHLHALNAANPANPINSTTTTTKPKHILILLARHGQGAHNVAEAYYGTPAWDAHYGLQNEGEIPAPSSPTTNAQTSTASETASETETNEQAQAQTRKTAKLQTQTTPMQHATFFDATLTPTGAAQARTASAFFSAQIAQHGMPVPGAWFASPLTRALQTCSITWQGLAEAGILGGGFSHGSEKEKGMENGDMDGEETRQQERAWKPVVKERLRERITTHTCDARRRLSELRRTWGDVFAFEEGMAEEDPMHDADEAEAYEAVTARAKGVLDEMFFSSQGEGAEVVSITAHGGIASGIMRAVGHRRWELPPGAVMAMLVKGEVVDG